MRLKIESNTVDLKKVVKEATDEFKVYLEDEITETTDNIYLKANNRVRVDKGFLKNHLYKEQKGLNAEVGDTAHYAPYVEFGTGGLVDVPAGLEDYAIQFKGNDIRQVNLPARPYLFNSAFEEVTMMIQRIKNGIK